ncbi:quinone oxidoreductase [Gammaproteobacteria bacterium]|uniref:NADPH:quinone reductase n=1 Tax=OM182 bacterium MED-G28 TaxID=1986256 RepID=A0A2A5WA53_9GAMM|nr:quinone oxidoreductase [Gammaproteobacteria bacterium]PDH33302.1 MAG: NADPH:quinone reductase [OM182 bacterium MED-G28]
MKAVRVREYGGPEAMSYDEVDIPSIGENDVLVKIEASGINFIDTYQRSGLYQIPLPATLGLEAAGTVTEIGLNVSSFQSGDRVAYTSVPGAYADYAVVPDEKLVKLPDGVDFSQGAAAMLQGCTAHYLCKSTYEVKAGDRCLIHAAAGGVGLLLIQMVKNAGGFVIGTVSTEEKANLAKSAGADEVILYSEQNFETEVKRITEGAGVNVVYDSVGKSTFQKSIDCLSKLGYMVLYGNASGPVTEFNPATLGPKGSLFLTRPTLFDYTADRESLDWRTSDVFNWIAEGNLNLRVEHFYALADAQQAHKDLEGRKTTGKIILTP